MAIVKGAKKGKDKARQPVIAPDSAQSKTYINILYGLAEGEIEGLANGNQSILLEETPLQDANGNLSFSNVKVDFRKGTNDQDYIEGFPSVDSETAVDVELKSGTPWIRAFNNLDLDAVRIRFKWGPLRQQDATSGDVSGLTIEYAIDIQTDGGAWTEVLKTKITDKTSTNYERAHRIDLPKADTGWLIRVRRITPNSTSEYVSDKMYIEAITEVVDTKLRYPNTALLGLRYDAETFSNVAKVAVDLKGALIQVPTNYNAETRQYTGMWDGTFKRAYTNNPAWIYYDLCTNDRYGLGSRLTPLMIDKWSLYRLAQYCDQTVSDGLGGQEPRFTCNVYLQSAEEAFNILMKLAGVFRAIAYWDGNSINCDADIPQDTYFTYSRANVIGGVFEYAGTRARDRHNVIKVAWDNPANHYKTEYEFVRDEKAIAEAGQVRILDLDAWGCTSRGQAQRAGQWALLSEQKETRTVSFKVGLDGHIPLPGRVIEVADELFAGRANGGRVSKISSDLKSITLDRDDVIAKAGDRLVINSESGKAQTRIVQSISGRVVTVTLPFDANSIAVQNVWVLDAKDLATMKFRVISIAQDEKHQFSITALQYNPEKFDEIDNGAFFEDAPISIINPSTQEPVKDVLITSENRVDQGINIVTMILSWTQAKGAVKYLVEWRKDDGSWIKLPLTGNNSVEVPGVYSGKYQARVTAISAFEIASLPVSSVLTDIGGKPGLPPKLAFIRATGILFGMKLDWGFPSVGAKDTAYTEIEVSPDGSTNISQLGLFAYPTTTNTIQGLQPNLKQFYRGRLIDRIGNVGPWSDWVNGITTSDPDAVLDLITGHISETDLAKELQGKIENTVDVAESAKQVATNAQTAASSAQTAATNAQTAATEAKTAASNAQTAALTAQAQASSAQQVANDASAIAANAKNTADQAAASALTANTAASEAKTAAAKVASDLTTSTNQLNQKIADESSARVAAISNLNDGLTTETTQRKSEDAALLSNIETYKSSTNGTLSSLQTQITTNATNTSANTSKITSLDSRLTTNEGKTADAISAAATAQQTANTAVTNAAAAASAVTSLRSELSSGKGINNIVAPFSDPQELPTLGGAGRTVALIDSLLRRNGKAYKVAHTTAAHYVYFGTAQAAQAPAQMSMHIEAGRTYMFSVWLKAISTAIPSIRFNILWFIRDPNTGNITTNGGIVFPQGQTDSYISPGTNGQRYSFKSSTAPTNAIGATIYAVGNPSGPTTSEYLVDMLMFEESIGSEKPASTWVAGPADLNAIKNAFDASATAINNLTTRVANDEGIITSQGNSITQLNNSITNINGTLSTKADSTALNALTNRVSTAEGQITAQGSAIVSLKNDLAATNNAVASKADSSAVTNLTSRVSTAEGNITSQGNSITSLTNSLAISAKAGTNLLIKSNVVGTYNGVAYPHLVYEMGEEWEVGAQYTLLWCAEHKRNSTDTSSNLAVYAGGGSQALQSVVNTNGKVVNKVTFTKNSSGVAKVINFYMINRPSAAQGSIGTVYWAVLVKGNLITTDTWIPSSYDYLPDVTANASAITNLTNTVTQQGNTITSHSNSITSLNNSVTSINGTLNNKADASALQSLDSKVTTIDGKVTSNTSALTALQSNFNSLPNQGLNLLGPEISNPVEKPTNWVSGLAFDVINSPDTVNVRAFQFTMPAASGSGTYFNVGGSQVPRQWLTEGNYVFSFVAKTVGGTPPHPIEWQLYNVSGVRQRFNITATLTRYSCVFTVPAGGASACMLLIGNPTAKAAGQVINIERMMLERQVGTNTTPSTWSAGADASGMIISTQAKATDLFNTATNQNTATAGRVTSLESRMTSTEGALSTKADASAVQNLDTKVTNIDGTVTSNTNAITSLNSALTNATSTISMNAGSPLADWTTYAATGEFNVIAEATGQSGKVIQLGNNAGNDTIWLHANNLIPFDQTKTYRIRARYRRRAGTGTIYLGIAQKTPDKALYVTTGNTQAANMASSNYVVNAHAPVIDEWQEIVGYYKGRSSGAASGAGSQASPRTASQMTGFISPLFIANYQNQAGIVELDYLILEDAEAIAGNQANATALNTLDTKVTEVDGRLATATNSITALNSRMSTAEGNIASNASAIANTYTKTQTDSVIAGEVNSFKASLQVAGTNLIRNGNFSDDLTNWAAWGTTNVVRTIESINGKNWLHLVANNTSIFRGISQSTLANAFKRDTEYTLSFNAYSANATGGVSVLIHQSGGGNNDPQIIRTVAISNKNARYTVTFRSADLEAKSAFNLMIGPQNSIVGDIFITDIMFAEGNVASGWSPSNDQIMGNISANANAVSTLTTTVTNQGNTITSQGTDITNLKNSVTLINGTLTNKADASAVNTLSNRVTAAEDSITSQGNSITSLNNTLANNDLSNLILNPDFIDPKNGWTSGVIVDATDAAPNPPSLKALKLNNRDSYYGAFVKCNVGDMFYVSAWFATPNTSATASVVLGFNTRNSSGTYAWYSVAVKSTDKNTWGFVEGYFTVPAGMVDIRPWLQVSTTATEAAAQLWHVTNIQVRNITGNKKLASDLQATSSALSTLDSKVTNIDGRVTSASNNIVTLNNSVTNINTALSQKADASALSSLSNRVNTAEGNISSQGNSITSLTNSLAVSGKGGTNLLIKSNVVGTYNGVAYPHHVYEMGEEWEVGAQYTLLWCAEHKRNSTDTSSNLAVYAGGGSQALQSVVNTNGKVVNKVTFTKNSSGVAKVINFYMINRPSAAQGSIGTVYWAVLVKGDVITTDAWIPSSYDHLPDTNANASAITNLTNTVTQQGNTITSHTNSITSLNNSITSINGVLNTKASTSAVTDLDSRVTAAEGNITANTSSITSLTANLKNVANGITMSASLDVDPDSEWIYWSKNGEVARADAVDALGGKVYRFGNNAGNDHVNARSKAKLPFDQTKTYRIRARYRRLNGTGTVYCSVCTLAADGISHVNSSNTVSSDFGSSNYFVINQSPTNNVWQEVTVYVKGRAAGAATGNWTLASPRQMPNATAFLSVQFLANYSSAAGMTELDYLIIEDADAIAANEATANALSSLDTRVTSAEGKITSQGNSITSLNNSITSINGTLASKADSSALTNLANRVTATENSITSQGSSITSLNSSVNGLLKDIEVTDTRSTNQPPSWYWANYPKRIVREFKSASTLGLTGMGTYVSLETYVYWTDASGGPIIQIARGTDSKLTAERRSTGASTWGVWSQDIKTISDGLANKAEASALSSLDSKVSVIDGKVSTQASSITNLQTTVGGHTSSIQQVTESVDGVKAQQYLKMDVNGHLAGHGSMNDGTTSTFIFNYDAIQFGAPVGVDGVTPKPLMTLQNTPLTLPNGTVIPRGLYVDTGNFGYINANRIWAENLSVISADLGTIKVKNANIEDGAIDTLKIKDEAVTVPIGVKAIDIKTINTFSGGSTGGLPNNDFSNHLSAWEEHIGTLLQVTLNRSGGKVRLDASVNICTPSFGAFSVGDGRGNPIAANDRAMASFYISIYRNGSLIGRGSLGANIETGNINVNFNGTAVIVSAIDDIRTVGAVTYTLKAGFARQEGVNIPLNVSSNSTFMITSRTLSVIEMKK
ncbi:phage tail protein [Acinetobacter baumannii]|uniref:TipJ family phage tail tip protein n=1 Tax=Acinetobacter baumannii TaxID=470 RepID=UPI00338DD8EA